MYQESLDGGPAGHMLSASATQHKQKRGMLHYTTKSVSGVELHHCNFEKGKWFYLEVHSPVWDERKENWKSFQQCFNFLHFFLWKFPPVGHFCTVEQRWFVTSQGNEEQKENIKGAEEFSANIVNKKSETVFEYV